MQKYEIQGNKKGQVPGNLMEKMNKCPTIELGVPRYPPEKMR